MVSYDKGGFLPVGLRIESPELMAGLSRALDLTEGEPMGHSIRSCWIGTQIAERIGIERTLADDPYYALLLKEAGCSDHVGQVSSWLNLKRTNWSRMHQAVNVRGLGWSGDVPEEWVWGLSQ